ncbi:phage terminase small subunit [Sphingopyxis yananensis]|uniref:phage terminase small subunit n=1 Tax=Sphingopyxis yananensis TaxID=2886687 RepID=UPI001D0FB6BF|nr:phage terminase small subunit [Sphingopyxis yananensis]MCC2603009.1 terminase [Sphingopyxis yananensis]
MSLARRHRDKILAGLSAANAPENGAGTVAPAAITMAAGEAKPRDIPAERAAQQIGLRLTHDLRDLKGIKGIDQKVAHKKKQIGEYAAWIEGLLEADAGLGTGIAAEIAPTIMVWHIDIGDYEAALPIGAFLIRHGAAMPARYNRDPASVLTEEIAAAALKQQAAGESFCVNVLLNLETIVDGIDMHDEIRAKLNKAIGSEMLRAGETVPANEADAYLTSAGAYLAEAQRLHDRIGVKDRLKRVAKLIAATQAAAAAAAEAEAKAKGEAEEIAQAANLATNGAASETGEPAADAANA